MDEGKGVIGTIQSLPQIKRNTVRFGEIIGTLAKYGLAGWLHGTSAEFIKARLKSAAGVRLSNLSQYEKVRLAITELGTTFIKLGQMLSTRPDLVGVDLAAELSQLQSDTPPDPPETVRATVESELGRKIEDCFKDFSFTPLGSASIGQVHQAKLADGTDVVVKVQHAGIEGPVRADCDLMEVLAELAEEYEPEARRYQPVRTVREFQRTLLRELDYNKERNSAEAFIRNFEEDESVRFPRPHAQLCARRVLTMDFLPGTAFAKVAERDDIDGSEFAKKGANVWIRMILEDGFFHADPHPGNLLVMDQGVLGIIDCGMVGYLDGATLEQFEDLVIALLSRDADMLSYELLRICGMPLGIDREAFRADVNEFYGEYLSGKLESLDLSEATGAASDMISRHKLVLPATLSQLIKTLAILEGTSRLLDRDFNLIDLIRPHKNKILKRRLSPTYVAKRMFAAARDWDRLARVLPQELMEILARVRGETFNVHLQHRYLDAVVNRLVYGMLVSSLVLASALMMSMDVEPLIWGLSVFGVLTAFFALALGFPLVRAVRKRGGLDKD